MRKAILVFLLIFAALGISVFAQGDGTCQAEVSGILHTFDTNETKIISGTNVTHERVTLVGNGCLFTVGEATQLILSGETKTLNGVEITIVSATAPAASACEGTADLSIANIEQFDDFRDVETTGVKVIIENTGDGAPCLDLTRIEDCGGVVEAGVYHNDKEITFFSVSAIKAGAEATIGVSLWKQLASFLRVGRTLAPGSYQVKVLIDPNQCIINEEKTTNNEATFTFVNACNMNGVCEAGEDYLTCGDCPCGETKFDSTKVRLMFDPSEKQRRLEVFPGYQGAQFKGTYEGTLDLLAGDAVTFTINGQTSGKLLKGGSAVLDGLSIEVIDVGQRLPSENPSVAFCLSESKETAEQIECDGCWDSDENKCYPIGKRIADKTYCGLSKRVEPLKFEGTTCEEHYECASNLCDEERDICMEMSIWKSFMNWLKGIFS